MTLTHQHLEQTFPPKVLCELPTLPSRILSRWGPLGDEEW